MLESFIAGNLPCPTPEDYKEFGKQVIAPMAKLNDRELHEYREREINEMPDEIVRALCSLSDSIDSVFGAEIAGLFVSQVVVLLNFLAFAASKGHLAPTDKTEEVADDA